MKKKACELCGCEVEPRAMKKYHIVPSEVREQAGIRRSKIIRLCSDCYAELHKWYSAKIFNTTYDANIKMFRAKSPQEMVKEYESAYRGFVRYKKGALEKSQKELNTSPNM